MSEAASVSFESWWFVPVDGTLPVRFRYNTSAPWQNDERVHVPAVRGRFQRVYREPQFAKVVNVEATFNEIDGLTARAWRERMLDHIQAGTQGYLKSPVGDVWKGVLYAPSGSIDARTSWETVRCTFRETGTVP